MSERQFSLGDVTITTYEIPTGRGVGTRRRIRIDADGDEIHLSLPQWRVLREAAMRLGPDCEKPVVVSTLDGVQGFGTQVTLWGYAITGDFLERSAIIAEDRNVKAIYPAAWDRASADLTGKMIGRGDEPYRRVKDWAALPWVAEHMIRGHEEWAGL